MTVVGLVILAIVGFTVILAFSRPKPVKSPRGEEVSEELAAASVSSSSDDIPAGCDFILAKREIESFLQMVQREAEAEGNTAMFRAEAVAAWQEFSANPNRAFATALVAHLPPVAGYFVKCSPGGEFYEMERILQPERSKTGWASYTSESEKFSARFPGEVKRQFLGSGKDDGISPATVVHSCQTTDGALYEVRVTRIIHVFGSPIDFLMLVMDEMVTTIGAANIVKETPDVAHGCPAVNFVMRVREVYEMRGVTFVQGNTVYIVSLLNPPGGAHEFLPFWNEFRLAEL